MKKINFFDMGNFKLEPKRILPGFPVRKLIRLNKKNQKFNKNNKNSISSKNLNLNIFDEIEEKRIKDIKFEKKLIENTFNNLKIERNPNSTEFNYSIEKYKTNK